jgi:ATP-binding cassette, subfamily B (MDR/TAP), member 1
MFEYLVLQLCVSLLTELNHRWGSKLVSQGEITFYSFFVSFMSVFFSGQGCGLMFGFANSG